MATVCSYFILEKGGVRQIGVVRQKRYTVPWMLRSSVIVECFGCKMAVAGKSRVPKVAGSYREEKNCF